MTEEAEVSGSHENGIGGRSAAGRGRGGRIQGFSGAGPSTLRSQALLGSLTREEVLKSAKEVATYPDKPQPTLAPASQLEYDAYRSDRRLKRRLRASPYYVTALDAEPEAYETYSSRRDRLNAAPVPDFASQETKQLLNPDFFPPALWQMIFEPRKANAKRKKRVRPKVNIDKVAAGAEHASKEDAEFLRTVSEDEQDNMTESEEEGGNDYEANYFDPGEDNEASDAAEGDEAEL